MSYTTQPTKRQIEVLKYIRNCIMHIGKAPSVRDIMKEFNYKSPRSAVLVRDALIEKGLLKQKLDKSIQFVRDIDESKYHAQTISVPLVGSVACGVPILAEENIDGYIPVSTKIAKQGNKYFFLKAEGDSMNKADINDGDLLLVRQQVTANENDKVVALIDGGATVKKFHRTTDDMIILKPSSTNPIHQPIILTEDFQVQGVVINVLTD